MWLNDLSQFLGEKSTSGDRLCGRNVSFRNPSSSPSPLRGIRVMPSLVHVYSVVVLYLFESVRTCWCCWRKWMQIAWPGYALVRCIVGFCLSGSRKCNQRVLFFPSPSFVIYANAFLGALARSREADVHETNNSMVCRVSMFKSAFFFFFL